MKLEGELKALIDLLTGQGAAQSLEALGFFPKTSHHDAPLPTKDTVSKTIWKAGLEKNHNSESRT